MQDIINRVTQNVGIDPETAKPAIGMVLNLLKSVLPPETVNSVLAVVPGASELMTSADGAGGSGGIGGMLGGALGSLTGGSAPVTMLATAFGRPGGIRTPNPRIWSPVLYQFELLTQPVASTNHRRHMKRAQALLDQSRGSLEPVFHRASDCGCAAKRTRLAKLLDDLRDDARTHGAAALTDGEAEALIHRDRLDELDGHGDVVTRHDHFHAVGQTGRFRPSRPWYGSRTGDL